MNLKKQVAEMKKLIVEKNNERKRVEWGQPPSNAGLPNNAGAAAYYFLGF